MKNQTFNPSRFAAYLKKYLGENCTTVLGGMAVFVLSPIAFAVLSPLPSDVYSKVPAMPFKNLSDPMWGSEIDFFSFLAIVFASILGSQIFSQLSSKNSRTRLLSFPASNLEKVAAMLLIYGIGFGAVYVGATFLADAIRVWTYRGHCAPGVLCDYIPLDQILAFTDFNLEHIRAENPAFYQTLQQTALIKMSLYIGALFFVFTFFALGSVVWPKSSYFKTLGAGMLWLVALIYLAFLGTRAICPHVGYYGFRFEGMSFDHALFWSNVIGYAIIAALWVLIYARFKEWEIIKRW